MFKELRIAAIRQLIELNEKLVFNRRLIRFYKQQDRCAVNQVIDVGANLGQSIDIFLSLNATCTIRAFEPNPTLFKDLQNKYTGKAGVQLFQQGVSDATGILEFKENVFHSTSSFEEVDLDSEYLKKKAKVLGVPPEDIVSKRYPVPVTTLSAFIAEQAIESIDVIKIDTEGHEYACLQGLFSGAALPPITFIQLEMHNDDMYLNKRSFAEISTLLDQNGFVPYKTIKHGFGDFDEVVFVNKDKA